MFVGSVHQISQRKRIQFWFKFIHWWRLINETWLWTRNGNTIKDIIKSKAKIIEPPVSPLHWDIFPNCNATFFMNIWIKWHMPNKSWSCVLAQKLLVLFSCQMACTFLAYTNFNIMFFTIWRTDRFKTPSLLYVMYLEPD